MDGRIYLDHAATTPLDPRVLEAMLPCLRDAWGNPSSVYGEAREARGRFSAARRLVAELLGAAPAEIIFTSGGSESDNLAIRGIAHAARHLGNQVVTVATEHHAVLHATAGLEQEGFTVTRLPVDRCGFVDGAMLEAAVGPDTALVSVMLANNETGTVKQFPRSRGSLRQGTHKRWSTLMQFRRRIARNRRDPPRVDALSLAAHKFYGPKGVGVLYLRTGTPLEAQIVGGSQEKERRAGTENVAGSVGLATALRLAMEELPARVRHVQAIRDRILDEIPRRIAGSVITGPLEPERRLANNASFCFEASTRRCC